MNRIALVGPEVEENLSLRYLASSLSAAGFAADIIPYEHPAQLPSVVESVVGRGDAPALVGLSLSFQLRAKDFLALAVALRRGGYRGHITAGGHFGTFAWRELLRDFPELDSICLHEAEETLADLARAVAAGRDIGSVGGLAFRGPGGEATTTGIRPPPDLGRLPWPDRGGRPSEYLGHRMASLVGSRGCYANCAFCCISAWHERTLPGRRFRMRSAEDVAAEVAELHARRAIDIFTFHDDNFFLPGRAQSLRRIHRLADALDRRGVGPIATVVKARPNDLDGEILDAMVGRLGLTRLFLGVETDSARGLEALGRRVSSAENHRALELLEERGVYTCFNMLIFDPSTRLEDLETNLRFMERFAEVPLNFGRVELYAGTPLLARMQSEGRCRGDYLEWDYSLYDGGVQLVFEMATDCFYPRNFSGEATPHRLMGTRFLVELARRFHAEVYQERWLARAKRITRDLTEDSVRSLREILDFAGRRGVQRGGRRAFAGELSLRLRAAERGIHEAAGALEDEVLSAVRGCATGERRLT